MKKTLSLLASVALGMVACAQQADPIVMRVNGKDVTRSEFEYSFNKNNSEHTLDKKSLEDYVQLFVDFKLKVAEAVGAFVRLSHRCKSRGKRPSKRHDLAI